MSSTPRSAQSSAGLVLFASSLLLATMGVQVKVLTTQLPLAERLPDLEVTCLRFAFGLAAILPFILIGKIKLQTTRLGGMILRGLFGTGAIALYYYAITHSQLTTGTLLSYTYVVFATIFSALWLREWPRRDAVLALVVAMAGIWVLVDPTFSGLNAGDLAGLGSGILGGLAITTVRDLRRTEAAMVIYFSLCVCGTLTSGAALLLESRGVLNIGSLVPPRIPEGNALALVMGVGVTGTLGQILLTWGFRYATALLGTLISLATVPLSVLAGILLFQEQLKWNTVFGGLMIIAAGVYLSIAEGKVARKAREEEPAPH